MESINKKGLSSSALHIWAMFFMLCDHAYRTIFTNCEFLTCIGRLAFPMFAFMVVEGFYHTSNKKKYFLRMLFFGLISEIPFNLMLTAQWFFPFYQNVMFTFAIGLCMIYLLDKQQRKITKDSWIGPAFLSLLILGFFSLIALIAGVDYGMGGILMIAVFFYCRKKNCLTYLLQVGLLYYINTEVVGGLIYPVQLGNLYFEIPCQGLALLSLPFIWAYNGQKGYNAKWFKYFCYAFYPAHALILFLIAYALYF